MLPDEYSDAWAILRGRLALVAHGIPTTPPTFLKALGPVASAGPVHRVAGLPVGRVGAVAVLPLSGIITQQVTWLSEYGLGTSAEQFATAHKTLVADPSVSAIVWDVNSPGGSVAGIPEAASRLFAMRGPKKTVAVSNSLMASAAYWLASAADEVSVSPSSLTGAIGVYTVHKDFSRANSIKGVEVTYIYAGRKKVDGNPDSPLSPDARSSAQQMADDLYGMFVGAVARHRRASQAAVRDGYGEGAVLTAKRAVNAGLADRVETLPQVLARLGGKPTRTTGGGRTLADAEAIMRRLAATI